MWLYQAYSPLYILVYIYDMFMYCVPFSVDISHMLLHPNNVKSGLCLVGNDCFHHHSRDSCSQAFCTRAANCKSLGPKRRSFH